MMSIPATPYVTLLVTYLKPQRGRVALLAVALLANIALQLLVPQLLGTFIDTARSTAPLDTLTNIALLLLGVILVNHGVDRQPAFELDRAGEQRTGCDSLAQQFRQRARVMTIAADALPGLVQADDRAAHAGILELEPVQEIVRHRWRASGWQAGIVVRRRDAYERDPVAFTEKTSGPSFDASAGRSSAA